MSKLIRINVCENTCEGCPCCHDVTVEHIDHSGKMYCAVYNEEVGDYDETHRLDECKTKDDWDKWINSCPDNVLSIEEVRKITAKIPYSMAEDSQK